MIQQTIFPFKIETTKERLTAHGGLALMAEFNHGIGLRELTDRYLPVPGSNRGFDPSVVVDSMVLMLQGGGRSLEDLRELKDEEGLMKLIGRDEIPEPDTVGDWLRKMGDPGTGQIGLKGLDRVRGKINGRILKRDGVKEYTLDADALWADPRQCSLFQDRGDCVQSVYWVQTAFLSGVMDETDHSYLSVEDGAGGGSDRQACWEDGSEINDGCGKIGIISRDQKKVF